MLRLATSRIALNRAAIRNRDAIVEQMADDLRVGAAAAGCVTERDLRTLGWTATQLALHGDAAAQKARALAAA